MTAQICITALYALSGILPLIGFYRLAKSTLAWKRSVDQTVAERGHDRITYGDMDPGSMKLTDLPKETLRQLNWDFALVGGGVVLAAIASIWSIWI